MPPRRVRLIARTLSWLVAHTPWLWPLLRRPTRAFWNRMAAPWGSRATSPGREAGFEAGLAALGDGNAHGTVPRTLARILEIGTGYGDGAAALAERFPGADIVAVDISEAMAGEARQRLPERVRVQVADAAALPFPDDSFDLVAQINVPVYFAEIARVLAPGGRALIASSLGNNTPYYTPHDVLRRRFGRTGVRELASGTAEPGDWWVGAA
jgi:SAM-dependent methyltransferase